jgi:MoaD family protein
VNVRLFAALRELAGSSHVEVDADDVAGVLAAMSERFGPGFDRIMVAGSVVVNGERTAGNRAIQPGDEVALLPPVSGGR